MDLIVAPHSVPLAQADKVPVDGIAQYATDGDPAQSIPATIFPAAHCNALTAEIVNAIELFGYTPDRNDWGQLAKGLKGLKESSDLLDQAIDLNIIQISNNESTITADFNAGNNAFHGWTTFFTTMEINRADQSSQNCLIFSYGKGDQRKARFYIAGDDKNFTIAAANAENLANSEILMSIDKDTKEFTINGTLKPTGADLAEYYHGDQVGYIPGTVMMFGGANEITLCSDPVNVFGVISTKPAFVMNSSTQQDDLHYPIVLTGRVPVRIKGTIKKHDQITADIDGTAKAITNSSARVIGRALEDKTTEDEGLVTCFVQALC